MSRIRIGLNTMSRVPRGQAIRILGRFLKPALHSLLWSVPAALLVINSPCLGQTETNGSVSGNSGGSIWGRPLLVSLEEETASPSPLPPSYPAQRPTQYPAAYPDDPGIDSACCLVPSCPAWQVSGEFLYLRPGRDAVAVAVPINGAIIPPAGVAPVQVGNTALVDISFQPAFRAGLARWFDSCSALEINYTRFEGSDLAHADATAPIVLRSLVAHPGTSAAPTDFLIADAGYDIRFQLADMAYRGVLWRDSQAVVTYLVGGRYAHVEQIFASTLSNATLSETVDTRLRFDGGGIRVGLDGQRRFGCSGFSVYALGAASLLGGTFGGHFAEQQVPGVQNPLVLTGWKDDRVVPILDAEVGVSWTNESGCLRLKAGYLFSGWYNMPTTEAFIHSVQVGQAGKLNDTLTFDGLTAGLEITF